MDIKVKNWTYTNINFDVKCIYTDDYAIDNVDAFRGFVNGVAATNYDIEYVFIDGIARITNSDVNSLESVFASVAKLTDITFVITVSAGEDELPEFLKKYI